MGPGMLDCKLRIPSSIFIAPKSSTQTVATSTQLLYNYTFCNSTLFKCSWKLRERKAKREMKILSGFSHLLMTVFLHNFSTFMVIPALTDVTMSALCPGQDECSFAIYLTGFQQAIIGLGTLVIMPLIGNLSDKYGRKAMLTLPMTLTIIPLGILGYSRSRTFFYAYFACKTVTAMVCEGSVHFLALAYVADTVPEGRRASTFSVLSGIGSSAFVFGNLSTRFLSTSSTFQVATLVALVAVVYMRVFLHDSVIDDNLSAPILSKPIVDVDSTLSDRACSINNRVFKVLPSLGDMMALLRTSSTFSKAAVVAFFSNLADVGLHSSIMYYLKARFHFDKNEFADLMVISGIAGTISQLLLMPILASALTEERLLSLGLFFSCAHMLLYSISWSYWVPYVAAMFSILYIFSQPCMWSIVSKQVGACEQGKAQGCISGISSFANVMSPLAFSPLTALFLSERAPFYFPGFSIACAAFASMIALIQSTMITATPLIYSAKASKYNHLEA